MAGKTILYIILAAILGISLYFLYSSIVEIYAPSVNFIQNKTPLNPDEPSYSGKLQFYPNMRFASPSISYSLDSSCSQEKNMRVLEAFAFLQNKIENISFYESSNPDLIVTCSQNKVEEDEGYFIAGEGGPTSIINTSKFYVISKSKILLFYKRSNCNNYNIELHELLHVFGFGHSSNINSLMYNISYCNQIVTNDILDELRRLYSIPQLSDLTFSETTAVKQGSYLNFTIEAKNAGLNKASNVVFEAYSSDRKFYSYTLGDIEYGEGKVLWGITKLPSNTQDLRFVLTGGKELNPENNVISFFI